MLTFVMVAIYLTMGFGAYWLNGIEGVYIRDQITKKFKDKADEVYAEFWNKTQIIPKKEHSMNVVMVFIILAWLAAALLWPVISTGGCIYEWVIYKRLCKKYEV